MDITLPNGQIIRDIPEGTPKEAIKERAILAGLAVEADFAVANNYADQPVAQEEELSFMQRAKGTLEGFGTLASGAVAEPLAGLAGLGGLAAEAVGVAEQGYAAEQVEAVRNLLTYQGDSPEARDALAGLSEDLKVVIEPLMKVKQWLGDETFEATDSAALAGLMTAVPDALLMAPMVPKGPRTPKTPQAPRGKEPTMSAVEAEQNAISDTLMKGKPSDIAEIVQADPAFYKATSELGMLEEPLASFASKNPQFVAVEQGLASVPASMLDVRSKAFISELSQTADNLIEKLGGTLDKGQMNIDFKRSALDTVEGLGQSADDVYGVLAKELPKTGRFEAANTVAFLEAKAQELGGIEYLPPKLRKILNDLKPKVTTKKGPVSVITGAATSTEEIINPTLGKIDQIRREIGQGMNKRSGPFKDVESGLNKAIYGNLAKDQEIIAQASGFADVAETAKSLIIQRKGLEDNLVTLLGRDLNQALSVNVAGAIKGLAKNEIGRFHKIMEAIPKAQRKQIVLSALNDVFRGAGVGQQSLSPTQFVKWYQNINRSPAVKKALFDNLPKGAPAALENLFKVASGVSKALGNRITTGRLNAMFNPETGFVRRIIGKAGASAVGYAAGGPVGSMATNATVEFLSQATDGSKRASALLASPEFQTIIRESVKEGVVDGVRASAELTKRALKLQKSKAYRAWTTGLSDAAKTEISSNGLISYLFNDEPEKEIQ